MKAPSEPVGDHSARRLSQEKREELVRTIQEDPTMSQRKLSAACDISLSTVNKVLREEGIRPWKFSKVQEIWPNDYTSRLEFANLVINRNEQDGNFVGNIVFSDEASFHLNGSVNMHNAFIYAEENPHAICVKPLRSSALTCWAMISLHHGITFHIQDSTMNAERYHDILELKVLPVLKDRRNRAQHFQQDGAPAHYASINRTLLDQELTNRWIGRGGPIPWPPRSPDLSINDFWLWGHMRDLLYREPRPLSMRELQAKLADLLENVEMITIRRAYDSFLRRWRLCIEAGGGHFEQFL